MLVVGVMFADCVITVWRWRPGLRGLWNRRERLVTVSSRVAGRDEW
jgi:hypothetical protein